MKLRVFSVFDRKAVAYLPIFQSPETGMASRSFSDAVTNPESPFNKHPEDYILYEIGCFDDSKGLLEPYSEIIHVIEASACLQMARAPEVEPSVAALREAFAVQDS